MDVYESALPAFTLWFVFIYMVGYSIVFKNWDKKHRGEASSCLMSLAHGTPALILSLSSILQSQLQFHSPNTPFQNSVLEYSIAYFSADLLHYVVFIPTDLLFIAHHLATLYVLLTCRFLFAHGAVAILGVLAVAELTTVCQNTWSLARYRRLDSPAAAALFDLVSPPFYGFYSVVRGIVGPLLVYKIGLFFSTSDLDGGIPIPRWGWISWIVVIVAGIALSILWVLHLWIDLYKHKRGIKEGKKLS